MRPALLNFKNDLILPSWCSELFLWPSDIFVIPLNPKFQFLDLNFFINDAVPVENDPPPIESVVNDFS